MALDQTMEIRLNMVYREFINAARKHNNTCAIVKQALMSMNDSAHKDTGKIKQLTLNLYYLSGYIIECSVKFGIYAAIGYEKTLDVRQLNNNGITFDKNIKHHRFFNYVDHFNKKFGGVRLIDNKVGISQEVTKLYNNWDVDIRYHYGDIPQKFKHCDEHEHVVNFYTCAAEVFTYIQSNIK